MPGTIWDAFVGRAAELDVLDAALARAESGDGAFVLIGGEPGIGKSSLVDRFAAQARGRGARVVWGRCWEAGGAPAYWPWVQVLRAVVRELEPSTVRDLAGVGAEHLAQIVPDLCEVLPELPQQAVPESDAARFRLFDAVASFLRATAAREQALVVALDDVHAADTPTLLLLEYLAREARDARLVLIVGYRSTELTREHPLAATLAELTRVPNARRLTLEGLAPGELSEYVSRVTGADVARDVLAALEARTEGNPLFVSELVRLMIAGPRAGNGAFRLPDEVPEGVHEAISRRVAALSSACRATLDAAAILGRDVAFDVLRALTDLDPETLLTAIDEALAAGLLVRTTSAVGDLRFSHVLVRDTLYEQLPAAVRARTHLRAAEVIEQLRAPDLEPHLSEVAHHYIAAGPVADVALAAEHALGAGQAAARRLAYEEAIRLLGAALELVERAPGLDDMRLDALLELGDAQARAGSLEAAQSTFREAAELARARRRAPALARAALGYGGRFAWCRAGADTDLVPLLQDALAAVGPGDTIERVHLLARLAGARRSDPDPSRRVAEAREAVAIARRLGDPRTLAYALGGFHGAIWNADSPDERLVVAEEMLENASRDGDPEQLIVAYCARWVARWEIGDFAGAREDVTTCVPLATRLQQPAQRWLVAIGQAAVALFEGRFEDVERFALAGRAEGQGSLHFDADSAYFVQMSLLRLTQDRPGELVDELARAADAYPWYPHLRALLARLLAADGRLDRAHDEMAGLSDETIDAASNYAMFTLSVMADTVAELGETEPAARIADRLAPYAHRNAMAPPEASAGVIARPLGVLSALLGRSADAVRYFDQAVTAHTAMGALPWLAQTHADYASFLRDIDAARAEEHATKAMSLARQLGMARLVRRHEPPATAREASPSEGTFRREGDYWTIEYAGKATRLRHGKGLLYLATLLARPGADVPALELAGMAGRNVAAQGTIEVLDGRARTEYRARIEELQREIDEADEWADLERASRARSELEFLVDELAGATGLGGRDRSFGTNAERARQAVKKAISASLAKLASEHPDLGRHLGATVRTGYVCRYQPDPRVPITWRV